MTDREAFLAAILSDPQDDTPRLIYADWLEENGEGERAEFVRVQVELARLSCNFKQTPQQAGWFHDCGADENGYWLCQPLRSRERDLFSRFKTQWFNERQAIYYLPADDDADCYPDLTAAIVRRGFISSLTCDWTTWLRHAPALHWHPEDKVECPKCGARGTSTADPHTWEWNNCVPCKGTGKVRRPFPSTAQPITDVRLTSIPGEIDPLAQSVRIAMNGFGIGAIFNRVKCPDVHRLALEPPRSRVQGLRWYRAQPLDL